MTIGLTGDPQFAAVPALLIVGNVSGFQGLSHGLSGCDGDRALRKLEAGPDVHIDHHGSDIRDFLWIEQPGCRVAGGRKAHLIKLSEGLAIGQGSAFRPAVKHAFAPA